MRPPGQDADAYLRDVENLHRVDRRAEHSPLLSEKERNAVQSHLREVIRVWWSAAKKASSANGAGEAVVVATAEPGEHEEKEREEKER